MRSKRFISRTVLLIIYVLYNFGHAWSLMCLTDKCIMVHVHLSPDPTVVTSASPVDTASEWEELLKNVTFHKVMHKMML